MTSIANFVHQQSVTTGVGSITMTAVNGRQTFYDAFGLTGANSFFYGISNNNAVEWEVGKGHLSDASVLVRDTVLDSSTGGTLVNFSAGTKDVICDLPAEDQANPTTTRTYVSGSSPAISKTDGNGRIYIALTVPAPIMLALPAISTFPAWLPINLKCDGNISGVNTVTLAPNGADTFEGNASYVMDLPFAAITIMTDGTQWLAE